MKTKAISRACTVAIALAATAGAQAAGSPNLTPYLLVHKVSGLCMTQPPSGGLFLGQCDYTNPIGKVYAQMRDQNQELVMQSHGTGDFVRLFDAAAWDSSGGTYKAALTVPDVPNPWGVPVVWDYG